MDYNIHQPRLFPRVNRFLDVPQWLPKYFAKVVRMRSVVLVAVVPIGQSNGAVSLIIID